MVGYEIDNQTVEDLANKNLHKFIEINCLTRSGGNLSDCCINRKLNIISIVSALKSLLNCERS